MSKEETTKEVMRLRDLVTHSPEQRAKWLWDRLEGKTLSTVKPTQWDLICFAAEVFALLSADIEFLQEISKRMVSIVYTAHYHTPEIYPSSCPYPLSKQTSSTVKTGLSEIAQLSLRDDLEKL